MNSVGKVGKILFFNKKKIMLSNNNIHVSPISGNIVMHFEITGKFLKNI